MNQSSLIAVEASAGTGKTFELAQRFVGLLLNPAYAAADAAPLRGILALTFTKKATVEMKERIVDSVRRMAFDAFNTVEESTAMFAATGLPRGEAQKRARATMDFLLANYSWLQVQTIDSFINALLQSSALQLGLSARFETEETHKVFLARSVDVLIELAASDPALRGLFTDFLDRMLVNDTGLGWNPREAIIKQINALHDKTNSAGLDYTAGAEVSAADYRRYRADVFVALQRVAAHLPPEAKYLPAGIAKLLDAGETHVLFASFGTAAYWRNETIEVKAKTPPPSPEADAAWDAFRVAIQAWAHADAYGHFNRYIELYRRTSRELGRLARREDVLFMTEFNRRAQAILGTGRAAVPEVYYRLATRIRHLLIDEFQDTNALQWQNFKPFAEEMLSTGGTVFYVGDRKQAIYGFRGGDSTLFDTVLGDLSHLVAVPRHYTLETNHRSRAAVVDFNNTVFAPGNIEQFVRALMDKKNSSLQLASHAPTAAAAVFANSLQKTKSSLSGGRVVCRVIKGDDFDVQMAAVKTSVLAAVADALSRGYTQGDITVLGRKKEHLAEFTQWLIEAGYRVQSERTANLREHPLIRQIIAFLQFLRSPVDNTAFAAFISGELFCSAAYIAHADIIDFLFHANARLPGAKSGYLYLLFRERWESQWSSLIEPFFTTAGFAPFYELLTQFLGAYTVYTRYPGQQLFVERFLALVHEHRDNYGELDSFLEFFMAAEDKELFVAAEDADAVQLITIHAAKGLQFPVVILPQLTVSVKRGRDAVFFVPDAGGLRIVKPQTERDSFSLELDALAREEALEMLMAELNALYVALTRARDELYIFIPEKADGRSKNNAPLLFPGTDIAFGAPAHFAAGGTDDEEGVSINIPAREYRAAGLFVSNDLAPAPSLDRRDARRRGVLVHAALAHLGNLYGKKITDEVDRAIETLLREEGETPERGELIRIVTHPALAPFFAPQDAVKVLCEHPVVTAAGDTRVFDRLIELPRAVWIIDYKSTADNPEGHRAQVRAYMAAARELYGGKTVKGWIMYLDTCTPVPVPVAEYIS